MDYHVDEEMLWRRRHVDSFVSKLVDGVEALTHSALSRLEHLERKDTLGGALLT